MSDNNKTYGFDDWKYLLSVVSGRSPEEEEKRLRELDTPEVREAARRIMSCFMAPYYDKLGSYINKDKK